MCKNYADWTYNMKVIPLLKSKVKWNTLYVLVWLTDIYGNAFSIYFAWFFDSINKFIFLDSYDLSRVKCS
jgi:hypothetical protein